MNRFFPEFMPIPGILIRFCRIYDTPGNPGIIRKYNHNSDESYRSHPLNPQNRSLKSFPLKHVTFTGKFCDMPLPAGSPSSIRCSSSQPERSGTCHTRLTYPVKTEDHPEKLLSVIKTVTDDCLPWKSCSNSMVILGSTCCSRYFMTLDVRR